MSKHNKYNSKEYRIWLRMKTVCYNKKNPGFSTYGGRGIKMKESWKNDFKSFYAEMGNCPENCTGIELIDLNHDFFKENCRWVNSLTRRELKDMPNIRKRKSKKIYKNPKRITVTLEQELYNFIQRQSSKKSLDEKTCITVSELIRQVLEDCFKIPKQLNFNDL